MKSLVIFLSLLCTTISARSVDSLLNSFTLEQKIGQMIIVYHAPLSFLEKYHIGGTLVMRNMISDENKFTKSLTKIQDSLTVPLLVSIDQEGGTVNRLSQKAEWKNAPSAEEFSSWSYTKSYEYHKKIASKLNELGVNINLAPVLDPQYASDGSATYMKNERRAFSENSDSAIDGFITAFTEQNIATTAKHFPGYDAPVNSDHDIAISNADSVQLDNYVAPFKKWKNQNSAIMMSSIIYKTISNEPAVFSKTMVSLAKETSISSVIMTDDLWGAALRSYQYEGPMGTKSYPDSAFAKVVSRSFLAGNDMLMITYPQKVPLMIETIKELTVKNPDLLKEIDISVRKILLLKKRLLILE